MILGQHKIGEHQAKCGALIVTILVILCIKDIQFVGCTPADGGLVLSCLEQFHD